MMVSNKNFKVKVNELITAMGGTPDPIVPTCEDDVALNAEVFATGINKIKQNIGGGGSGGGNFNVYIIEEKDQPIVLASDWEGTPITIAEVYAAFTSGKNIVCQTMAGDWPMTLTCNSLMAAESDGTTVGMIGFYGLRETGDALEMTTYMGQQQGDQQELFKLTSEITRTLDSGE